MKGLSIEEENIIKDIRNLFRLKKRTKFHWNKNIRNLFRLEKETKAIKDRIFRDIKNIFEHEEENYYKPVRVSNFWSNNYTEYESNGDKNKTSVQEYLNKIRPYLKDINNLKNCNTWKIQLTIAINFISSIDNDEERVLHSKSDNMINYEANQVVKELFDSLKNRYQNNLTSMKGSEFVYDYVLLMYYKSHKINLNRSGSYVDSPYWIENQKAATNPINKKDKCFQYTLTAALREKENILKENQKLNFL